VVTCLGAMEGSPCRGNIAEEAVSQRVTDGDVQSRLKQKVSKVLGSARTIDTVSGKTSTEGSLGNVIAMRAEKFPKWAEGGALGVTWNDLGSSGRIKKRCRW